MEPENNILNQFPNDGIGGQIDASTIAQTTPPGYEEISGPNAYSQSVIDAQRAQQTPSAIGPQGAGLYPGMKHNINVGGYSGSMVGSQNIYVPGGNIAAVDPVLARRKAIDDAAKARAAQLKPFEMGAPSKLKDQRFQRSFDDAYYNRANTLIEQAQQNYGKDFGAVLTDQSTPEGRKFIQEMANFETLGGKFDQIVDLMAGIDVGLQDKTKEYSKETLGLKREFENLVGNFDKGDVFATQDLDQLYNKLKGHRSFEDYIQTGNFLDDISGITSQYSYDKDKGDYYKTGTTQTVKFDDAINEVVDSLANTAFAYETQSGIYDKEYMKKAIRARLKDSIKQTGSIQQKSKATRDAEIEEFIATPDAIVRYADEDGKRGNIKMFSYDENGKRGKEFKVPSLAEFPISISGKQQKIYERTPDGKLTETTTKGIPLNNVNYIDANGNTKTITGNVIADMTDQTVVKLADGRVAVKSRVWVPTTTKGKKTGIGETDNFDSYTPQDHLIVIQNKEGQGQGGVKTQIIERGLKSEEAKQSFEDRLNDINKKRSSSTTTTQDVSDQEKEDLRTKYNY